MTRPRRSSATSEESAGTVREQVRVSDGSQETDAHNAQELGSMYDYLAKIILLGPSGTGK